MSRPVALITGSGRRRLGWEIARTLAQQGYVVALHYFQSQQSALANVAELRQDGYHAEAFPADLREPTSAGQLIENVLTRFGRLDVLVNAAAIWESRSLEDITADDLRHHWETNVLGTFVCAQQAGLAMARQDQGGCIINFGDWAILRPYRDYAAYFVSKGTIPTLTRVLAVELALRNPRVRVNAILPGPVMVPDTLTPQERDAIARATLVKRLGEPRHVVQAVLYLIENDFVTGACLTVDGGRSIFAPDESSLPEA
ncbi:MAG: SDR family oxidoreductase [Gemmatales bacterium]|nr:SDR family oxidoreductase [Gemmatales bacterium]MDW8174260.1 SDR family oxidoreductase [Gemmatales bacterium]